MQKLLLLTGLLLLSKVVLAQSGPNAGNLQTSLPGNGKITGVVLDSANQKPVEFATVALYASNSDRPLDGAVCDDKGKFTINKVEPGDYKVVISFIGYKTKTITVTLTDKKDDIDLGSIKIGLETAILKEVTVEGQKAVIEERVDRTIYNAENDATARGGDASDVLKRVPMLSVDLDGNVSMRGSQNIKVLINNKPSTIMAANVADALKQIPADEIKSVEVITSPSAKYDAEGTGGIINIITKKNTLQGLTLGINTGVGYRGSNLGLNGNYRKKKMGFSLGGWGRANYNVNGSFENSQKTRQYSEDPIPVLLSETTLTQKADTRNGGIFGHYNLGWDYDINKKNFLAANLRFGARNQKNYQDDLFTQTSQKSSLANVKTIDLSNTVDFNLTYTHQYEKPQREFSLLGSYSRNTRDNDFENITVEENGASKLLGIRNENDSYNEEITLQADYQSPIGENQMIEFGGKDIMRKVFSDFTRYSDSGDGIYIPSTEEKLNNNLNYDQNVVAGYLSYTLSNIKSFSFKAGTRYEYTTITAYTKTEDNIVIPSYGILVPSANISKKLKGGSTVKAAYNRRIQRPSIQFLNPNIQGSNPTSITIGNPSLQPEYTNNVELSYNTFIKGTSLNFTTFWRNTNNSIQSVRDVLGKVETDADTIRTTYQNIGEENAYGLSLFANVNIGSKFSLHGGSDIYYATLKNNNPNPLYNASNEGWVATYRLFGNYNLNKGWGLQFFGFLRGRQVQLQGYQGGFGMYSVGFKKDFNDKKGSFGLAFENFATPSFKMKSEVTSPLINQNGTNVMNILSFRVNFSYRIGKMNMENTPRRRKSINNDDLKEGDGDNGGAGMLQGGGTPQGGGQPAGGRQRQPSKQGPQQKPDSTQKKNN